MKKMLRCIVILANGLPTLLFAGVPDRNLSDTCYAVNNRFLEHAFPYHIASEVFSIPTRENQLLVIYPASLEHQATHWQGLWKQNTDSEAPFLRADTLSATALAGKHLILMGNINDNPFLLELYRRRQSFADATFPGKDGYVIHPTRSLWGADRNVLVVGASTPENLDAAFRNVLSRLSDSPDRIGAIRVLKSILPVPVPPETVEPILTRSLEQANTLAAPYGEIANWGLYYQLTGDERWATHFKDAFRMLHDRAKVTGKWVPEPWTNLYFTHWKFMLIWREISRDPVFTDSNRRQIEEVLWGYTRVLDCMPNLDDGHALKGEMRQNHTTFLALSLYFSYRHYKEQYGADGLEHMMAKVRRAFDDGQANTFIPNDDAGNYLKYAPLHTLIYLQAENNSKFVADSNLARITDLIAATYDNFGNQVSFGDFAAYRHQPYGSTDLGFFSMAATHYQDGAYQWMYNWLAGDSPFSWERLYSGEYAGSIPAADPKRFTGINTIFLDSPALAWMARRSIGQQRGLSRNHRYFHKISFRNGFEPNKEYLLLDGVSAFSHGHHDGNSVLRLAWKDRIWLFDLDYTSKVTAKFHNGVTIVRDGEQFDPPMATRLDLAVTLDSVGITKTTAEDGNGADWERSIVWAKDRWFLVLDRIRANKEGEYRMLGHWRTRGESQLDGATLTVTQGDKHFFIQGADGAPRYLEFESDGYMSDWSNYPWGDGGLHVLVSRREQYLQRGEDAIFANLLVASDRQTPSPYQLHQLGKNLYRIQDSASTVFIGIENAPLRHVGMVTDADMFWLDSATLVLFNATAFDYEGISLDFKSTAKHVTIDLQRGVVSDFANNVLSRLERGELVKLRSAIAASIAATRLNNDAVEKTACLQRYDFALSRDTCQNIGTRITASDHTGHRYVFGDEQGKIVYGIGQQSLTIETSNKASIAVLTLADVDHDGAFEVIAGDASGHLYCYDASGALRWSLALAPYVGASAVATCIAVDAIGPGNESTILVGTNGWKLYAISHEGRVKWESFVFYHAHTKLGVLKRHGDSGGEIVVGTNYQTPFNVVDPETGKVNYHAWEEMGSEFSAETPYFGHHLTDMAILDVDGDGLDDIVFGTRTNRLYAVKAASGEKIWEANTGDEVTRLVAFDDTQTGEKRILVGNDYGDLLIFNGDGKRMGRIALGHRITDMAALPATRGRAEIVVSTDAGNLAVVDDELNIRGFFSEAYPLKKIHWLGEDAGVHKLMVIGEETMGLFDYEPLFLRESRHY